jgi:hypothetical protein
MNRTETEWLLSSDERPQGGPELGFERYAAKLAWQALVTDIADADLFDMCMYLRDKVLDDDRFEPLARQAEEWLHQRMNVQSSRRLAQRGSPGFEPEEYAAALEAVTSGKLTSMKLLDLAELAHSERHGEEHGSQWEAIYDLTRIQLLRRINRARLAGKEAC